MPLDQVDLERQEKNMSFLDHLEELRWHIVRSLIAVSVFAIVAFIFGHFIFDNIIFGPMDENFITYRKLCELGRNLYDTDKLCMGTFDFKAQNLAVSGQLIYHIIVSLLSGFIIAFPYILWEFWKFLKPALNPNEQKRTTGIVFISSFLFLVGIAFGYFILTPLSINFLGNYSVTDKIQNEWTIESYISFITLLTVATGIVFELPLIIYFLAKLGLVSAPFLRKYRKHAVIVTLVLSSVLTPPDIMSQILLSFPIYILYEIGIIIALRVDRKRAKEAI